MKPPRFLFIETTTECNLRCRMCHLWMTREPSTTLRTNEKIRLVEELAAWSSGAVVVLTGGETMQKTDEFFALTSACRRHGLSSAANTNGTLIDEAMVDRLLSEGPRHLVLSLDSQRPELHDRMRGRSGTWERVVSAIRTLVKRRAAAFTNSDVRVMVNCILFDENLADLAGFIATVTDLGVDGIMFQVLDRTFGNRSKVDVSFETHFPRDRKALEAAFETIAASRARGAPIVTTDADLRFMRLYAERPDAVSDQVCGSAERNLMVDMHGNVQLCFNMHSLFGGRVLGNVRDGGLRCWWESEFASEARGIMSECRKSCGMLNCHRKDGA